MSTATLIMVVLICVGCALGIAGLVVLALGARVLLKAAKKAGIDSREKVAILVRQVQGLGPKVREFQKKQEVVAERLKDLSTSTAKLRCLFDEFDRATGGLRHLKS